MGLKSSPCKSSRYDLDARGGILVVVAAPDVLALSRFCSVKRLGEVVLWVDTNGSVGPNPSAK